MTESKPTQHHVHALPAVGITSTEPGRKGGPCKPGGRARLSLGPAKSKTVMCTVTVTQIQTQTLITKRKPRHA